LASFRKSASRLLQLLASERELRFELRGQGVAERAPTGGLCLLELQRGARNLFQWIVGCLVGLGGTSFETLDLDQEL
jgi:hypothetical protein